ncbi:MAG: spermidine/putrescine ABC transporter substrate-binding protein [Candidatus Nanopelagicales bacterium]
MTEDNAMPFPVAGARQTGLSRRHFLSGVGAAGAAVASAGLLAGCGNDDTDASGETPDQSTVDKKLNVANWQLYIDTKRVDGEKTYPTLEAFQTEFGIEVAYTEPINDNEEYFAKIRPQLAAGNDIGQDLIVMTDWMASNLINIGYLQKLDKTNIPNLDNIVPKLKSPVFDPNRDYSIPWQSGVTGIAYDAGQIGEVGSISDLLTNPELNGSITVLKEMRDTMGLIMLDQGANPEEFTEDEWNNAIEALQSAVDNGQVRQFTGNNYAQLLAKGDLKACIAWSGDVIQLQFDNPDIKFVVPDAGGMLWSDNMLIPNGVQHKLNAELWMNYYYQPEVAAELAAWVNYICPVVGAQEIMAKTDKSLAANPLIFPTEEDYAKLSIFRALTDAEAGTFTTQFQALYT